MSNKSCGSRQDASFILYYSFSCDKRFSKEVRETKKKFYFTNLKVLIILEHSLFMQAKKNIAIFIFEGYFLNI